MKKIISLFSALAMVFTMTTAFAAIAPAAPTMKIELIDMPETLEVGSTFKMQVSYSGLELSEAEENYAGIGLTTLQAEVLIPGYGEYFTKNGKAYFTDVLGTANTSAASKNLDESTGKVTYAMAKTPSYDSTWRTSDGVAFTVALKVLKVPTTKMDFVLENAGFKLLEWGELDNNTEANKVGTLELRKDNITVVNASIGSSEPTPVVTSIDIAGADTVEAEATAAYTATVKDADGAEMADETVTWSIKEDTTAATIDAATGVLTAGKPDADTTVTVVATSATKADVSAEKTVTIGKYVPPVVDPTIELTAEEGKDSAAGAYTFFYKAVITKGTEAITAADVTITSGKNSRRAFLSEDMLANIGGGITFYVGNMTADAGRTFSAVGTVNGIASNAVDYTTPAE